MGMSLAVLGASIAAATAVDWKDDMTASKISANGWSQIDADCVPKKVVKDELDGTRHP